VTIKRIALAALVIVIAVSVTGCSLFEKDPELRDVSARDGLYHFQIPSNWQDLVDSQAVAIYAADELPEAGQPSDTLSIIALTAKETTDAPVADEIVRITTNRSIQRSWTDTEIGDPYETTVGGRTAFAVEVAAIDGNSNPFMGRFYLVRTAGSEILIVAVAPTDLYADYVPDLEGVIERWYWHQPDSQTTDMEVDMPLETTGTIE